MLFTYVRFGSFAEINDTPKAAVRAAPIEGEADLAIQQKRPFASGKFQEIALGAQAESIGRFLALALPNLHRRSPLPATISRRLAAAHDGRYR
jgi:hypothetical protein